MGRSIGEEKMAVKRPIAGKKLFVLLELDHGSRLKWQPS
jgi:hypothetical protein